MALNNVTFILGQNGLGRPLPGQDYVSGLIYYCADDKLPSGFSTSARVKQIFSVPQAVAAGITNTHADEVAAIGEYIVTGAGATGDTITVVANEPDGPVTIAVYTQASTDTTTTLIAAGIRNTINANTKTTGYSATSSTADLFITVRPGLGLYPNSKSAYFVCTPSGAGTGTVSAPTGGVASLLDVWYYHIARYFAMQPKGNLYVGFYTTPGGSYNFNEVISLQNSANGAIRQIGVYKQLAAFSVGDLTALNTACQTCVSVHKETIALLGADISGTADISALTDLSSESNNLVAGPCIAQDVAGVGGQLWAATGKSITALGAMLGSVALAKVSESIAWVQKFNVDDGTEFDVVGFANGQTYASLGESLDNLLGTLQNYRYCFFRKIVGVAGTFWNENPTCTSLSSDYAFIADNRTMQKATRNIYANTIPALNGPITLNDDGTPSDEAVAYFGGLTDSPLITMVANGELSAYAVNIPTDQNVLSTGQFIINVILVEVGTGRNIIINIGYGIVPALNS
jgi:Protein of unknown function (DUF2586)